MTKTIDVEVGTAEGANVGAFDRTLSIFAEHELKRAEASVRRIENALRDYDTVLDQVEYQREYHRLYRNVRFLINGWSVAAEKSWKIEKDFERVIVRWSDRITVTIGQATILRVEPTHVIPLIDWAAAKELSNSYPKLSELRAALRKAPCIPHENTRDFEIFKIDRASDEPYQDAARPGLEPAGEKEVNDAQLEEDVVPLPVSDTDPKDAWGDPERPIGLVDVSGNGGVTNSLLRAALPASSLNSVVWLLFGLAVLSGITVLSYDLPWGVFVGALAGSLVLTFLIATASVVLRYFKLKLDPDQLAGSVLANQITLALSRHLRSNG